MTTRKRKTFDPSLKLEVVRMVKEQGLSIQNVSESMDIEIGRASCRERVF